jgi:CDP-glucose 4,6-dehydratase
MGLGQHVLDPLSGYLPLTKRLTEDPESFSGAWNFGPLMTDQISVLDLARRFVSAWGSGRTELPGRRKRKNRFLSLFFMAK